MAFCFSVKQFRTLVKLKVMAKQIYSLDEDKMVDVMEAPPADKKEPEETEVEEKEEEETGEEEEKEEEPKEEESSEESSEEGEESGEEVVDEKKADDKPKEEEAKELSADEVIRDIFSEKYGINNEQEFREILDHSVDLLDTNEKLTARVKELEEKPTEPVFKSENHKAVYEMIKDYDPDRIPDGLNMVAALVGMDLDKTDNKLILEQHFIMEHPELPLDKARKKFQRRFEEKYTVSDDAYEDPEDLKEKREDLESDLAMDAAKAKKAIKEKQKEYKIKSEAKDEPVKVNEEVQSSIARYTSEFNDYFSGLDTLSFQVDDNDPKNLFNYKFSKEELAKIKNVMDNHLKHPAAYDAKGNLIGGFDPEEKFQTAAFAVSGQLITQQALKFAQKMAQVIKVEDIAKKKPDRKAKVQGKPQDMSIDAQADRLAAKRKAERETVRR